MKHDKLENLLEVVRDHVALGNYVDTRHAKIRKEQRRILTRDVVSILMSGFHEKKKDKFDPHYQEWNYAIRGKLESEDREIRVIISFDEEGMLIITAIELQ